MVDMAGAIRFESVSRRFDTPARGPVWALRDVTFAAAAAELTCVLGPSGCGKTTLLRLAAGLDSPTAGRVFQDGQPVAGPPSDIGLVSQEGSLLPWRRVIGNVALGLEINGVSRADRQARAQAALQRVALPEEVARSYPHELSGGMRQRVALARALCVNPRVLLMDEPFAAVDEPTRHHLQDDLLRVWAGDGQTILFVTHSLEEAVYLADRVLVMTFARTIADFRVDLARPRDRLSEPFVQTLVRIRRAFASAANGEPDTGHARLSEANAVNLGPNLRGRQ